MSSEPRQILQSSDLSHKSRTASEHTAVRASQDDAEKQLSTDEKQLKSDHISSAKTSDTKERSLHSSGHDAQSEQTSTDVTAPPRRRYGFIPVPPRDDPGPPPDGGLMAWLQVLAGCLIGVVTWGLITSFGIFQTDYADRLGASPSAISWIGTLQTCLLLLLGVVSGRASDAGFAHEAVLLGSFLIVFGLFMLSLAETYWQVLLSQGICIGAGMGILYMPGLSVPSTWFKKNKSFAAGLMASGNGIGGVLFPGMYKGLLPAVGFAWSIRSIAFVVLAICIVFNLLLRVRVPPRPRGPLIDRQAFREPAYPLYIAAFFLVYWAIYFAFYYIDAFGHAFAGFTSLDSIQILLISNALGVPGRIMPGIIASRWLGPLNTAIPLALATSIILYCWTALLENPTHSTVYAYAAVYGLIASALQASFSISLASITDDLSKLGTRMGMVFAVVSFAALTGSPIAGALIERENGGYLGAVLWAGSSVLLAAGFFVAARVAYTGWVWTARV